MQRDRRRKCGELDLKLVVGQKTYPDETAVEYAYDLAGKVLQVSDPTGSYGFAYDNMGRLVGTSTQYA